MNAQELYNKLFGDPDNPVPPERRVFSMDSGNGLHEILDVITIEIPAPGSTTGETEEVALLTEKNEDEIRALGHLPEDIDDAQARHEEANRAA